MYSTEGKIKNEYEVLVGVIWSPKLNRLALSLMNDEYNIPPVNPGKELGLQIPIKDEILLSTMGTRIVIDENGHYAVLAYAQAQPRRSSSNREQAALQDAKQIAANRARAMIVNYIKEGMTIRDEEQSQELSREFSDGTVGTENLRNIRRSIEGRKVSVKLSGIRVLKEWNLPHPETNQEVAGAVIAWSPSSSSLSKKIDGTMKARPSKEKDTPAQTDTSEKTDKVLESMEVDTSAY